MKYDLYDFDGTIYDGDSGVDLVLFAIRKKPIVILYLLKSIKMVVLYLLKLRTKEEVKSTIIAYEPIWAIGTGKTATSEDANNAIKEIRNKIEQIYGKEVAEDVIIQYGGSVKSKNAKELFTMSDIDGGLVGGASLDPEEFSKIVNYDI